MSNRILKLDESDVKVLMNGILENALRPSLRKDGMVICDFCGESFERDSHLGYYTDGEHWLDCPVLVAERLKVLFN